MFEKTPMGNYVAHGDGFHVSFRPHDTASTGILAPNTTYGETALVRKTVVLILNGDFREHYAKALPNWDACYAVYMAEASRARSTWSSDTPIEKVAELVNTRLEVQLN